MIGKLLLTILVGIYTIRGSWFLFSGHVSPLTPVAAIVAVLCVVFFHRPPQSFGLWYGVVIGVCVVAMIANGALLFAESPLYRNTINTAFCWTCIGAFGLYAAWLTTTLIERAPVS